MKKVFSLLLEDGISFRRTDLSRLTNLRFSGLPFCQLRLFFSSPTFFANRKAQTFTSSFYTSVGTAIHDSVQSALVDLECSPTLIGDWECTACHDRSSKFSPKPSTCSKCGKANFKFHEHEIRHTPESDEYSTIIGHIDTIYQLPSNAVTVTDWKSCKLSRVIDYSRKPSLGYRTQLASYAGYIQTQYRVRVKEIYLGFIPRDDPTQTRFWKQDFSDEDAKTSWSNLLSWSKQHRQVMLATTAKEIYQMAKHRPCLENVPEGYYGCPYARVCVADDSACKATILLTIEKLGENFPLKNHVHL